MKFSALLLSGFLMSSAVANNSLFLGGAHAQQFLAETEFDLTGEWLVIGDSISFDESGCHPYAGSSYTFSSGEEFGETAEYSVNLVRDGDEYVLSEALVYSNSRGTYSVTSRGTVSGNEFSATSYTSQIVPVPIDNLLVMTFTGTISEDGNTIVGEYICRSIEGPDTAVGSVMYIRVQSEPIRGLW